MEDNIVFGKNSVMEALIAGDREINKIIITKINMFSKYSYVKILISMWR